VRIFTFKIFDEADHDLIKWLDSLPKRERSAAIRRALRLFKRGKRKE
jgi:hypothetical protein